jgi:hypothetical protein
LHSHISPLFSVSSRPPQHIQYCSSGSRGAIPSRIHKHTGDHRLPTHHQQQALRGDEWWQRDVVASQPCLSSAPRRTGDSVADTLANSLPSAKTPDPSPLFVSTSLSAWDATRGLYPMGFSDPTDPRVPRPQPGKTRTLSAGVGFCQVRVRVGLE